MLSLSKLFDAYQWHLVRLGGVSDLRTIPIECDGVAIFASETLDDVALEVRYRLLRAAPAPHPVRHARDSLRRKDADVAFVAAVPDAERERLVDDIREAIAHRK